MLTRPYTPVEFGKTTILCATEDEVTYLNNEMELIRQTKKDGLNLQVIYFNAIGTVLGYPKPAVDFYTSTLFNEPMKGMDLVDYSMARYPLYYHGIEFVAGYDSILPSLIELEEKHNLGLAKVRIEYRVATLKANKDGIVKPTTMTKGYAVNRYDTSTVAKIMELIKEEQLSSLKAIKQEGVKTQ